MIRFDKLTVKAQEAAQATQEVTAGHDKQQIEPLHLLAALLAQQDGVVLPILERLGVRAHALGSEIETELGKLPKVSGIS
jgi:ATP-dependent Clp protease ATP-binding subunit ClpB